MHNYVIRANVLMIIEQNYIILLPHHQNWRASPVLRNRDIYLRYYTETLFLERIGLDRGVHVSISPISGPQMSSSASELTSFCASSSALSIRELVFLRILFNCNDIGCVDFVLCFIKCAVNWGNLFLFGV